MDCQVYVLHWVGHCGGISIRVKHGATQIKEEKQEKPTVIPFADVKNCERKTMA